MDGADTTTLVHNHKVGLPTRYITNLDAQYRLIRILGRVNDIQTRAIVPHISVALEVERELKQCEWTHVSSLLEMSIDSTRSVESSLPDCLALHGTLPRLNDRQGFQRISMKLLINQGWVHDWLTAYVCC
jgi:hypothetical protein